MSHIEIHDYTQRARRSLGRLAQVAALPPQPARHDGDHWDFGRRGFAHALLAGHYDDRVGSKDPRLLAIQQAAIDEGVPIEDVEELTLDDLLVTPDLLSVVIGGKLIQFRPGDPRREKQLATLKYKPSGRGGIAGVQIFTDAPAATRSGGSIPDNVFLRGVHVVVSDTANVSYGVNLSIGGRIPLITNMNAKMSGGTPGVETHLPLTMFVERGGPLLLTAGPLEAGGIGIEMSANLSYEFGEPI